MGSDQFTKKLYSKNEVYESTIKYFDGDKLSTDVWINKYCLKDIIDDNIIYYEKDPTDMHNRLASEFARIENKYENPLTEKEIFETLDKFKYIIPQGSPMSGIGNNKQIVSLSNCYVVGNESDSYGAICLTDEQQIQLMKRRGGVGHDLSHIRPKGSPVKNSAITSTGIVSFMERYSNSTKEVAQNGRRGALMLSISINHPDSEDFIDAKMIDGKITGSNISVRIDDEFMKAIENKKNYIQKYPIYSENPRVSKEINPSELWKKIIHNAWKSAEPGVLFWDTVIGESVPDCYADQGFKTISTNPCVVGDTLIAVADGRNAVSIKQLAEEGKDVPVYSMDNEGKLVIRKMRNPRITGYDQQIYKVTIEGGISYRVTGNHVFVLRDNDRVEAKNLKYGDSLKIMTKYENKYKKSNTYYTLRNGSESIGEHRLIAQYYNKNVDLNENLVVHHKDYNGMNNNPENLVIMSKEKHDKLHTIDKLGKLNSYHSMSNKWKLDFASHPGENNPNYSGILDEEIKNHAIILTKQLGKRFSKKDWINYARKNNLPQYFTKFRNFESVTSLAKLVAIELEIDFINNDPRLVETYKKALNNGYNAEIRENCVMIEKTCENCGKYFWVNYIKREISFCSHGCSLNYINTNNNIRNKRKNTINDTYNAKGNETKQKQLKIYNDLEFNLKRIPLLKEWEKECKENEIPFRLKTKYGFSSYNELKEESVFFNHKVLSVELDGIENVYNGTVDDFHTYFITDKYFKINVLTENCGEIPLCSKDSCRLLALNLYSYVINPFTDKAYFDFDLFKKHVWIGQRLMDDMIDLEIEKIYKIIEKINSDPEEDYIKGREKQLWLDIKEKTIQGRRTGFGTTGEGDMLAALNKHYGTKSATEISVEIHKFMSINAYKSSCNLAKERGTFPIYDYNREINNPFINRLKDADKELSEMLKNYGRRNISLLTLAPTGSVSTLTQTTSGIEPAYLIAYKRRRKINQNDNKVKIDFTDAEGIDWEEYVVFHHKFVEWLKIKGFDVDEVSKMNDEKLNEIIKQSPYFNSTSNDIDWVEKVNMQGQIQKWIDHSISVTVNLPHNITEELVSKVYETGWKSGCKGITIYRDGSRQGVIVKKEEKKTEFEENNAPKRPRILECDVIRFTNKGEKWIGFIGILKDSPYEIFTGLAESFVIPAWIEKGQIRKEKIKNKEGILVSRYDFIYIDKEGYEVIMTGLNRSFAREYWNIGKMTSALLRHHIHLPSVVGIIESLNLDGDTMGTWKKGIIRMLKKYIKDDKGNGKNICPNCGSTNLVYKESCISCLDCHWSKCE